MERRLESLSTGHRVRRFLGDLLQAFTFGLMFSILFGVAFAAIPFLFWDAPRTASTPEWWTNLLPKVYLYVPWALWILGFVLIRVSRRFGKEFTAFRIKRVW